MYIPLQDKKWEGWLLNPACVVTMVTKYVYSTVAGADPGFWERGGLLNIFTTGGGYGRGRAPPVTARGFWGSADSSPSGVRFFAFAFI